MDGKSGGGAFSADMLSGVKLKRTEVHESSGDASRDELKPYEKIYEENGGDLDRIAVAMGGIQWKPDLPAIRDARDFAEKILAGSLVRSTTRAEGGAVWKPDAEGKSGGGADASAGGK
eukprot:g696.t1